MQKRLIEYKAELLSFEANEKLAGVIPSAVYRGFDIVQGQAGLGFQLAHTVTGHRLTKKDLTQTPYRGIWISRQGTTIIEDAPIQLSILSNQYNYERWDVLVGEHIHDELTQGGLEATYTVIPGGDNTEPSGISETQTVLGRIRVPANATTSAGIIWERRPVPQLGGKLPALLAENNQFTGQNSERHTTITTSQQSFDGLSRGILQGMNNANSYTVNNATGFILDLLPKRPLGTMVSLTFKENATLRGFSNQLNGNDVAGISAGYRPLSVYVNNPLQNFTVLAGETATFRMVDVGTPVTKRPYGEYWSLVALTDSTGKALSSYTEVADIKARLTLAEQGITINALDIRDLGTALSSHTQNTSNPHNTTKEQVGLGNIPNSITSEVTVDDAATLATARAAKRLNDAISAVNGKADNALANAMPKGGIIMWSGSIDNIPTGYVLCDGRPAVNGQAIPDLRNKFIRGASDLSNTSGLTADDRGQVAAPSAVGQQGGNNKHQMTIQQMPPHTHGFTYNIPLITQQKWGDNANTYSFPSGETQRSGTTASTGGLNDVAQEFNLMPQYYALAFIIKTI